MTRSTSKPSTLAISISLAAAACATPSQAPGTQGDPLLPFCDRPEALARAFEDSAPPEHRAAIERWAPGHPVPDADRASIELLAAKWAAVCGLREAEELTRAMVAFPTVGEEEPAATSPAFAAMADFLRRWAEREGFVFSVFGQNDAWEITLGEGPRTVGFVMHADVVPVHEVEEPRKVGAAARAAAATSSTAKPTAAVATNGPDDRPPGWSRPPFTASRDGDKLYGRGTEDDKGPIAAVLVAMKAMKTFGVTPRGQVVAILGTGEESNWDGMRSYAASRPAPRHVISIDAGFPVVIAESGFVGWHLSIKRDLAAEQRARTAAPRILDARAGLFLTQVPGEASMTIAPGDGQKVESLLARARQVAEREATQRKHPWRAEVVRAGNKLEVRAFGEAVHSSVAETGHNALWLLSAIAKGLQPAPSAIADVLNVIATRFDGDHLGERLGLAHTHELMGPLLVAPTLLRVREDQVVLSVNMRRPAGVTKDELGKRLDQTTAMLRSEIGPRLEELTNLRYVGEPALADTGGPLVPTLLDVYRRHTGDAAAKPVTIRGGTYARLFPGAVSFGPSMPGRPYRGHAPDEYIEIDVLGRLVRMVLEATFRLDAAASAAPGAPPALPSPARP